MEAMVNARKLCFSHDIGPNTTNLQLRRNSGILEHITIGNWEKIFHTLGGPFFSRVESITVHHLHQLQGPIQVANLQNLRALTISDCNRLKCLLSTLLARNLPQLSYLVLSSCEELEQIIEMEQSSASSLQNNLQPIFFPSLEVLIIDGCKNLKSLFPVSVTYSLRKLENVSIQGASKLEHVFENCGADLQCDQKGTVVLPELGKLLLVELPSLKSFAPTGYHFRFPCLGYFAVIRYPELTTKFRIDSNGIVHAVTETEASSQVQIGIEEGFTTMEEIVADQPTGSDIFWTCVDEEEDWWLDNENSDLRAVSDGSQGVHQSSAWSSSLDHLEEVFYEEKLSV